jgi:hypothetical protein
LRDGFEDITGELPSHSQRLRAYRWESNGAMIEVFVYEEAQPDRDQSDRIHLITTGVGQSPIGLLMNAFDAALIIELLGLAISRVIFNNLPTQPESDEHQGDDEA